MHLAVLLNKPQAQISHTLPAPDSGVALRVSTLVASSKKPWREVGRLVRSSVLFLCMVSAATAFAQTTYYWNIGASRTDHGQNLADPYLWGNTVPGSVTTLDESGCFNFRWSFSDPIRTSQSVTWSDINFGQNQNAPFSGTVDLSLTNALGETTGYAEVLASHIFRAGYNGAHAQLTLTAGTLGSARTATSDPSVYIGDGSGNGQVTTFDIAGPHAVFQTSTARRTVIGQSHSSYVTVRDGGLYSGNFYVSSYGGSRCQRESVLRVTGAGSRLEVPADNTGDLVVGAMAGGNSLIVTNGASMTVSSASMVKLGVTVNNKSPGTHNRFLVTDNSTFSTAGGVWTGLNSSSNLFEVSGGSTATVNGWLLNDNGPLEGIALYGNCTRATGGGTVLNANGEIYAGYFGGHESRLEVVNGARLNVAADKSIVIGHSYCPDCTMSVTNGGTVQVAAPSRDVRLLVGNMNSPGCSLVVDNATLTAGGNHCGIGNKSTSPNCSLTIRAGASVTLRSVYVGDYADNCTLTVADSSLACADLRFGTTGGKDNFFNLSGANVRIKAEALAFDKSATWNVTLPATEPAAPLITCSAVKASAPVTLNVSLSDAACACKTVLLQATQSDISDETMANLSVSLPKGWKFRRSADRRRLTVSPERGFTVIVK